MVCRLSLDDSLHAGGGGGGMGIIIIIKTISAFSDNKNKLQKAKVIKVNVLFTLKNVRDGKLRRKTKAIKLSLI